MPFNELIQEKLLDFEQQGIPKVFERSLDLGPIQRPERGNLAKIIVGSRRCGKTFRLYQEMHDIISAGYPASSIMYFNFEDERLKPYSPALLSDVIDTYFALHPNAKTNGCFLFFDEIQEIPDWGLFLRRIIDATKATVYVTGSSSKMLSSELKSEFRGRALSRELFPMGFSEYVRFTTGEQYTANSSLSSSDRAVLRNALNSYLVRGGFIAPLALPLNDALMLLQEYAHRTAAMDIVERYNLRSPQTASLLLARCLASSARELSINKVANEFKSRGIATSRETLSNLIAYYEEAYVLFSLYGFSRSIAENSKSSSKVYAIDPGMFAAFAPANTIEVGQRLETAVFNKMRREEPSIRKGALSRLLFEADGKRHEIDFVMGDALISEINSLVQVCVSLDLPKTKQREVSALEAAMNKYGIKDATIVTMDTQEDIDTSAGTVHVVPAWKWLLDSQQDKVQASY